MTTSIMMAVAGSVYQGGSAYNHHGGTNLQDVLRDSSDSTWDFRTAVNPQALVIPLDQTLVATAKTTKTLQEWTLYVRQRRTDITAQLRACAHVVNGSSDKVVGNVINLSSSNTTATTTTKTSVTPVSDLPTHIEITDLTLPQRNAPDVPFAYPTPFVVFYEAYVKATFADLPANVVTAPTGSSLDASPQVAWTYTSNEGLTQNSWAYAVYPTAATTATGFAPFDPRKLGHPEANGAVAWNYGGAAAISSPMVKIINGEAISVALPLGTYRVYVWTQETLTSGVVNVAPLAYSDFTIATLPPAPPYFAVGWDDDAQAAQILAVGRVNMIDANTAGAELGSGSWAPTGGTLARSSSSPLDGTQSWTLTATASNCKVISGPFPVTALNSYRFGLLMGVNANSRTVSLAIDWYNSLGANISTTGSTAVLSPSSNTSIAVTGTAPAGAVTAKWSWQIVTATVGEVFKFDDAFMVPVPVGVPSSTAVAWSPGGYTAPRIQVQRSVDNGDTWVNVRRVADELLSADDGVVVSLDTQTYIAADYEVPRGMVVDYRARVIATNSGAVAPSAWVVVTAQMGSDGRAWLKATSDPTLNRGGTIVLKGSTATQLTRQQGIFRIIGRTDPVVTNGSLGGQDGTMTVWPEDVETYEAFVDLLESGDKLLWQEAHVDSDGVGLQRYIKIAYPASWRGRRPPFIAFDVSFVEVSAT